MGLLSLFWLFYARSHNFMNVKKKLRICMTHDLQCIFLNGTLRAVIFMTGPQ